MSLCSDNTNPLQRNVTYEYRATTMMHSNYRVYSLLLMILALVIDHARAEILFGDGFEPAPLATRQLDVDPGTILLTASGETEQLAVGVFDTDGNAVAAPVSFRSTRPEVVSVSATGEVTALGPVGSAKVMVSAEGALEVAVLVVVADPVDGALVIDEQQVASGPELVDPEAELAPGMELRLVISGIDLPAPGTPVVGTGGRAVGGRVLSATLVGGGVEVILQVVPTSELFDAYAVNETLFAAEAQVELNPDVAALYTIDRRLDGSIELRQRPGLRSGAGSRSLVISNNCEAEPTDLTAVVQTTLGPSFDLNPQFSVDVEESETGLGRLVLEGSAFAIADLQARTTAGLMGKVTCKYALGSINFPAPGLLGFLVALKTKFGVGVEVAGRVGSTEAIGYDLIVTGEASFSAGIECPDGVCAPVGSASAEADGTFDPVFPSSLESLLGSGQLQLDGSGFFFVDLGVGNPFLDSVGFEPLGVNAGLRQRLDAQASTAQATNPAYGSDFRLELFAAAGAKTQFESLLGTLGIVVPPLVVEVFEMLAQSPQGTLVVTDPNGGSSATPGNPATVQVGSEDEQGELATFEVTLNPATYLGLYAVEEVQILELVDDGVGGQTLESVSSLCTDLNPDPGQTTFTCQTDFLETGTRNFYLFVRASLFGVPLPFLLEAGNHTQATLEVVMQPERVEGLFRIEPFGIFSSIRSVSVLSADASLVVGEGRTPNGEDIPFRWSDSGESISIQQLAGSQTLAMSDDGSVIVGYFSDGGYRWSETSGISFLGTLGDPGSERSRAFDTSADGTVVVGRAGIDPLQPHAHAFRWENGVMTDLGTFGGGRNSWAYAVTGDGNAVVGFSQNDTNTANVAFRWTEASGMQPIGTIRGHSVATDVSANGSVIVGDGRASDGFTGVPFRWEAGVMTELQKPVNFSGENITCCVSADGSVVVGNAYDGDGEQTPWRWTAETGVQTLEQWFTANGLSLPPLRFPFVRGLSADGRTMLIEAFTTDFDRRAYLATVND